MRRRKNTTHRESIALSCAPVLEKVDDLAGRAGFAQLREDARNAVAVSILIHVGHRIDREDHVESEGVGVTRRRVDPGAGGDANDHDSAKRLTSAAAAI